MISTKSLDFMIFGSANTTESPPRATGKLNAPRKWTFRKCLEKSEKIYSTYLADGWSIHTSIDPSVHQDSKNHWFHWKSRISLKSIDFKKFNDVIIAEAPPLTIIELNRPRKWTFRKCLEKSEKTYSTHLADGWSIHTSLDPSVHQDSKNHRFHWKSRIFNEIHRFLHFQEIRWGDHRGSTAPDNYRIK